MCVGASVISFSLITSTQRFSCFLICSKVASSELNPMVILETVGSSVTPTVILSILYDLPDIMPEILAKTPIRFSTYRDTHLFLLV